MNSNTPSSADTKLSLPVQRLPLSAGLYIVASPIGNLRDITLRALDTLASVDMILCEDTRHSQTLLRHYGITEARRVALHDHNERAMLEKVTDWLAMGKSLALISDAGMPLIADPGYRLVLACRQQGHYVTVIPGASALLTGLALGGLPTDSFYFAGFLKKTKAERLRQCAAIKEIAATLAFYVSPHKLAASLTDALAVLGDRPAVLLRELTKRYESVYQSSLADLVLLAQQEAFKGEMLLLVAGATATTIDDATLEALLVKALQRSSVKQAADEVSARTGLPKRQVYQRALRLKGQA